MGIPAVYYEYELNYKEKQNQVCNCKRKGHGRGL
jgi:hypothetical protein